MNCCGNNLRSILLATHADSLVLHIWTSARWRWPGWSYQIGFEDSQRTFTTIWNNFSDVLHVRTSVHRVRDLSNHMLGDHDPALLFPPVRRRLPLVVAGFSQLRLHSRISIHLLLPLLCYKTQHWRRRLHFPILWLYLHYGVPIFPFNRYDRLHGLFLVRKEDLQCGESWLDKKCQVTIVMCSAMWFFRPVIDKLTWLLSHLMV